MSTTVQKTQSLSPDHFEEIILASAVNPDVADARGYRTLTGTPADRDELEALGFRPAVFDRDDAYPGLLVPMYNAHGEVAGHQFKPFVPRMRTKADGTLVPLKYETPPGAANMVDVPAFTRSVLGDLGTPLWITEGMKKVDALVSQGIAALGLTGVFNWRSKLGTLGDWEDIPLKGRTVVVCFDSDAAGNRLVQLAMTRLGAWLRTRGVETVHYLITPAEVDGTPTKGVDDFFSAGGTLETLRAAATQTAPGAGEKDAAFTDALLVEELGEHFTGHFCWAHGLGWLRWTGQVWREVSDVEPLEMTRQWAAEQFDKVLSEQRKDPSRNMAATIAGRRAILGKARLTALRDLARGVIQRDADEFDGNPDLLTVSNGTVDLRTGKLLPFDPEHCITKQADAAYRPGYTHPVWTKALTAIPAALHTWYQDRLGQACTGYPIPDHMLVISHGSGSNGKSTVVSVVRKTLGGYGVLVSDRVLMASPDAHPTELMDLRGARYAVMEETPEARHLNVQRLKTVLGTPTIKARRIRQDPVEFLASHSLFINTNYRPVVTETDHGTWRRLALMPWPFTFRKPGTPLAGPTDLPGDPALEYAAADPDVRAAALAWMVAGAQAWYARGRMMLPVPPEVERETLEWRSETDLILGFVTDCLTFERDAFTASGDMLKAFNEWAEDKGHRAWTDRTFASRFAAHDVVRAAKVAQGRFSVNKKQQRGWKGVAIGSDGRDPFTGELWEPPAPEPDPAPVPAPREPEFPEMRGGVQAELVPAEPDPARPQSAIGFDLETADADQLFTGSHDGPFVRLVGTHDGEHDTISHNPQHVILNLNRADVIYGHNILGFDLLALARHHGADYDALAAKAVDTMVLARLVDPPLSKGMPAGYYGLDQVAQRLGHQGKTDDIKALAKLHGGFDRIPVDDPAYAEYLRGDLAATKAVYEGLRMLRMGAEGNSPTGAQIAYAEREMRVVALQNRMTLNGWAVDTDLLRERIEREDAQRAEAVQVLHTEFGMPLAKPDKIKMLPKAQWPDAWKSVKVYDARAQLSDAELVDQGLAELVPGEVYASPWATDAGRQAIVDAFAAAGAPTYPRTKTGALALSSDALGAGDWFDPVAGKARPGMLKVHGDKPAVRRIVEALNRATGATAKYAEIGKYLTADGRVHGGIGEAQGSGRWAMTRPSLTNMGKRGAAGEQRAVLVADPGHVLITCDLSQVDMRAMAGLSQDPAYMALFAPGRDAHSEMAVVYFGELTDETRSRTKAINHKLNYGGAARSTAEMNGIPLAVVEQARDARAANYPRLVEYIQEVRDLAATGALLDNGFGRLMRPDPERAWTQGPALMGQGAARDIMCESLLRLVDARPDVRPYLRGVVHDEVIVSVPEADAAEWAAELERAFTWEWRGVPILCEVSKPARRWSECK